LFAVGQPIVSWVPAGESYTGFGSDLRGGIRRIRPVAKPLPLAGADAFHRRSNDAASGGQDTILQTIMDEDKRGRVMSLYSILFMGMAPFGSLLPRMIANRIGAPRPALISGAVCMLGAACFALQLKSIRDAVRPIYRELGVLPEIAEAHHTTSALRTPAEL
jgi:hypothetical protein